MLLHQIKCKIVICINGVYHNIIPLYHLEDFSYTSAVSKNILKNWHIKELQKTIFHYIYLINNLEFTSIIKDSNNFNLVIFRHKNKLMIFVL